MPIGRVCDTNVLFNIATGVVDPRRLKAGDARILITPVNILELVSNLTPENFGLRRSAAIAALNHADGVLPDPESYLRTVWNVTPDEPFE